MKDEVNINMISLIFTSDWKEQGSLPTPDILRYAAHVLVGVAGVTGVLEDADVFLVGALDEGGEGVAHELGCVVVVFHEWLGSSALRFEIGWSIGRTYWIPCHNDVDGVFGRHDDWFW